MPHMLQPDAKRWETRSEAETEQLGASFAAQVYSGLVIALYGGMGMGKTAFVRGLARGMGLDAEVSSPTFSLVHDYGGTPPLIHFDMYRISGWDDLDTTGFFEYLDAGAVLVVEWSEHIENALPPQTLRLRFSAPAEHIRIIERF